MIRTVDELIEECKTHKGVFLAKLPPHTELVVETINNMYSIDVLDNDKIRIMGGEYFPQATEAVITGSTWGGSAIKVNWVGLDMRLEIHDDDRIITTSWIKSINIITPNYEYKLEL